MLGVVADSGQLASVRELFELFKTPWEPAQAGARYSVVLILHGAPKFIPESDVVICYGNEPAVWDRLAGAEIQDRSHMNSVLRFDRSEIPLYCPCLKFGVAEVDWALEESDGGCVGFSKEVAGRRIIRIGYDLLAEWAYLRDEGQPAANAGIATLELHLDLVRSIVVAHTGSMIEVPSVPWGHNLICSLTHDVDFFGLRRHRADRTLAGFLYRATVKNTGDLAQGRRSVGEAMQNWTAALKTPLVLAGLATDPWHPFQSYGRVEAHLPATFFLIPFKHRPGSDALGRPIRGRGIAYDVSDLVKEFARPLPAAWEFGLHGIDAWHDPEAARTELARFREFCPKTAAGIRMHWLKFDRGTPELLDRAAFAFDSTLGYNEAVGFRAGTAQVFGFPGARHLLELPMIIQDTALFYPGRMHLTRDQARDRCHKILDTVTESGGCVTINWHDRSLEPERLWGAFYRELLEELSARRAWFTSASAAVAWFRGRRLIEFGQRDDDWVITSPGLAGPPARLRLWRSKADIRERPWGRSHRTYEDRELQAGRSEVRAAA